MEKGIILQGYLPMRLQPSQTSEMVSQVLFGEEFQLLDVDGIWQLILLDFDGMKGWVVKEGIHTLNSNSKAEITSEDGFRIVCQPSVILNNISLDQQLILPAGSILPGSSENHFTLADYDYIIHSNEGFITPGREMNPEVIGTSLISLPYIGGGRSGFGFDGPGLVQMLCRMMGIQLPRHCAEQAEIGETINFMHEIKRGDLAFFENASGDLSHVGMALKGSKILHAAQSVRIDKLDQHGIYNIQKAGYTHKLRVVKRVIGDW